MDVIARLANLPGALPGACAQGLIWGIMAIGVYLTYRILDVADLTVDGSFGTGGAVCVMCLLSGQNVWVSLFMALLAGLLAGFVTGILHTFMGIPAILAGILTQLSLYSINLKIMGKANQAINVDKYDLLISLRWVQETVLGNPLIMVSILIVAVIIIIAVLVMTSRAYMEVPVLLLTFGAAALLNMGTNFLCGKISFISDSIAVVLQLALAIDYAIILCHRFSDEHETKNARDAAVAALSKAIPEISASSLTTVSGLAALAFMKFTIGMDMAMVLIKAIMLSLLSVFTLMPGLLVLFSPLIDKTRHRKLIPNISFVGKFAVKTRRVVPPLFLLVLVGAFILSSRCPYSYNYYDLKTAKMTERQTAYFKIKETFGVTNMVAVVIPSGDYGAEKEIIQELKACPEVKSVMGLSGTEAMDGYMLTDALNPREFSELAGMDYEVIQLLYASYAAEHNEIGSILSGLEEYEIPLFDMFVFLKDQLQAHNIQLSGGDQQMLDALFSQLGMAQAQLQNERYSRLVVVLNLPEESDEAFAFLDRMHEIIGRFYDDDVYLVGNSTSSRDLASSFETDNLLISVLSSFFVIVVLLFTFQSAGLPVLLIIVIQGSIWINFSFPTLTGTPLYFLGYLIVQAIQMGANIDYAIVISSHYQEEKRKMPHK